MLKRGKEFQALESERPKVKLHYVTEHVPALVFSSVQYELKIAPMVTLSLIKEARIYSGEKTVSSISGAGKTGQVHVKV